MIFFVYRWLNPNGADQLLQKINIFPAAWNLSVPSRLPDTADLSTVAELPDGENIEISDDALDIATKNDISKEYSWFSTLFKRNKNKDDLSEKSQLTVTEDQATVSGEAITGNIVPSIVTGTSVEEIEDKILSGDLTLSGSDEKPDEKTIVEVANVDTKKEEKSTSSSPTDFDQLVLDPLLYSVETNAQGMIVIQKRTTPVKVSETTSEKTTETTTSSVKKESSTPKKVPQKTPSSLSTEDLREADEIFNL